MKRLALLCALVWAGAAAGEPAPPIAMTPQAPPAALPARARMFLSPSGEPFRGPAAFDAWFDQADADHDGKLSRAEFRADAMRFFKRLDANGDGVVDGFELSAYERDIAPELTQEIEGRAGPAEASEAAPSERPHHRGRGQGGSGGEGDHDRGGSEARSEHGGEGERGGRGGHLYLLNEPEPVSGADFNLDGRVTAAEWLQAADQRFDLLDTAKQGFLTREALRTRLPKAGPPEKGKHDHRPEGRD